MNARRCLIVGALLAAGIVTATLAQAGLFRRHYYSSWSYYPQRTYHYSHYYYKPYSSYQGYKYHYCVYYPSKPRYTYYYNPYSKVYWGRYDLEEKGYSLLADADRKGTLKDIPEEAFPKPAEMPPVPDSEDGEQMAVPPAPPTDAPSGESETK